MEGFSLPPNIELFKKMMPTSGPACMRMIAQFRALILNCEVKGDRATTEKLVETVGHLRYRLIKLANYTDSDSLYYALHYECFTPALLHGKPVVLDVSNMLRLYDIIDSITTDDDETDSQSDVERNNEIGTSVSSSSWYTSDHHPQRLECSGAVGLNTSGYSVVEPVGVTRVLRALPTTPLPTVYENFPINRHDQSELAEQTVNCDDPISSLSSIGERDSLCIETPPSGIVSDYSQSVGYATPACIKGKENIHKAKFSHMFTQCCMNTSDYSGSYEPAKCKELYVSCSTKGEACNAVGDELLRRKLRNRNRRRRAQRLRRSSANDGLSGIRSLLGCIYGKCEISAEGDVILGNERQFPMHGFSPTRVWLETLHYASVIA